MLTMPSLEDFKVNDVLRFLMKYYLEREGNTLYLIDGENRQRQERGQLPASYMDHALLKDGYEYLAHNKNSYKLTWFYTAHSLSGDLGKPPTFENMVKVSDAYLSEGMPFSMSVLRSFNEISHDVKKEISIENYIKHNLGLDYSYEFRMRQLGAIQGTKVAMGTYDIAEDVLERLPSHILRLYKINIALQGLAGKYLASKGGTYTDDEMRQIRRIDLIFQLIKILSQYNRENLWICTLGIGLKRIYPESPNKQKNVLLTVGSGHLGFGEIIRKEYSIATDEFYFISEADREAILQKVRNNRAVTYCFDDASIELLFDGL